MQSQNKKYPQILQRAAPNGWKAEMIDHGPGEEGDEERWELQWDDVIGRDYEIFNTLKSAEIAWDKLLDDLRTTKNWDSQALYDQENGTDNGGMSIYDDGP